MDQNKKPETYEKNNQTEKAPQQDLKTSNQNTQNKDAAKNWDEKNKAPANPELAQKPASDQVKHS